MLCSDVQVFGTGRVGVDVSAAEQGAACPDGDTISILERLKSLCFRHWGHGAGLLLDTRWQMDLLVLHGGFASLLQPVFRAVLQRLSECSSGGGCGFLWGAESCVWSGRGLGVPVQCSPRRARERQVSGRTVSRLQRSRVCSLLRGCALPA